MTIIGEFGCQRSGLPLVNVRGFALEQLISIHGITTDLRWAMVELALHSFTAMYAFAQGHLVLTLRKIARRGKRRLAHGAHC